jgi:hypothetical protein
MSYSAYTGRPALVARYRRRRSAPASVHIVALFHYLSGLVLLAVAVAIVLLARVATGTTAGPLARVPQSVRDGLSGGGYIIAGALGVLGLLWLLVARKLQRGQQWARITVIMFSMLSVAAAAATAYLNQDPHLLAALAPPLLYIILLATRAARSWFRYGTW